MIGQFALGLAITAPIMMFCNLQLRGIQATDARNRFIFAEYVTLRMITTCLAMLACVTFVVLSNFDNGTKIVIILVALTKGVDAVSDVVYGRFQRLEQMSVIAKAMIANGALSLVLLGSALAFTGSLITATLGYLAGSAIPLVFYLLPRVAQTHNARPAIKFLLSHHVDVERLRQLFRLALPLGFVMLVGSLSANSPRFFLEGFQGAYALGIFTALASIIAVGNTLVSSLGQAVSPRMAVYLALNETQKFKVLLTKLLGLTLALGILGCILAVSIGNTAITLLYTAEYAVSTHLLMVLVVGGSIGFAASVSGYGMTAAGIFTTQIPVSFAVLVSTLVASITLIPQFGLMGGAYVLLVSACVQLIASLVVIVRFLARMEKPNQ